MKFAIIIEKGPTSFGAYAPDIPGCIGLGDTADAARRSLAEGLQGHLRLMAEDGDAMPVPVSTGDYLEVEIPAPAARP